MSTVLRYLLGIFAVLCFVQYIEMARIARDENAATKLGEFGPSFNHIFQEEWKAFEDIFYTDEVKKFLASGPEQVNQFIDRFNKASDKANNDKAKGLNIKKNGIVKK